VSRYDWMADAQCAQIDPGLWHAESSSNYTTAKRICRACPVQRQCADHTARLDTDNPGRHGMWAGQTRKQREAKQAHAEREARRAAILRLTLRGGMDAEEIAGHVGCNVRTVWRVQKAHREQVAR